MPLIINGECVDDQVLEQEFAAIKSSYERLGAINCCERDEEFRGYARDNVVGRVLLAQEACRVTPPLPPETIDEAMENLKREHGGADRFYTNVGLTPADDPMIRRDIEMSLRVQTLVKMLADAAGEPGDDELRSYYDAHLDSYLTPEKVSALHIIKRPVKVEEREKVYAALRQIREQILDGADFKAMAYEHCDSVHELDDGAGETPGTNRTIELGFFGRGEMMEEFEFVAFSMRIGEISPVFPSAYGFHILKITDRVAPEPRPFEEARPEVCEHFLRDTQEHRLRQLVDRLKAQSHIEEASDPLPR